MSVVYKSTHQLKCYRFTSLIRSSITTSQCNDEEIRNKDRVEKNVV